VVVEVGFALHGWSAVPRYLFEPAALLIVIAATGVGRLLAAGVHSSGFVRWAGPALAAMLLVALVPAARSRARFVHGEVSYSRDFARQVDRLQDVIAGHGGGTRIGGLRPTRFAARVSECRGLVRRLERRRCRLAAP
jgi:hypothetical protein